MTDLVERLRVMGKQSSEIARMMAQDKSLRQAGHNPPRDDLYFWPTPEQTPEWKAADEIQSLSDRIAVLEGAVEQAAGWFDEYVGYHRTEAESLRKPGAVQPNRGPAAEARDRKAATNEMRAASLRAELIREGENATE